MPVAKTTNSELSRFFCFFVAQRAVFSISAVFDRRKLMILSDRLGLQHVDRDAERRSS